jgi:hypothetical protein
VATALPIQFGFTLRPKHVAVAKDLIGQSVVV